MRSVGFLAMGLKTPGGRGAFRRLMIFSCCCSFICFSGRSRSQSQYRLSDVVIEGNQAFSAGDLQERAFIQTPGWFSEKILGSDPVYYSEEMQEQVRIQLTNFYQKEGFLSVRMPSPEVTLDDKEQTAALRIRITEGIPVVVDTVGVRFSPPSPPGGSKFDTLLAGSGMTWNLRKGMRFRDELARKDQEELSNLFAKNGYPYAAIRPNLHVREGDSSVAVQWEIDPGILARFGGVTIEGNANTSADVILTRVGFDSGEVYDVSKLRSTQRNVINLGIFHGVNCRTQTASGPSTVLPVRI